MAPRDRRHSGGTEAADCNASRAVPPPDQPDDWVRCRRQWRGGQQPGHPSTISGNYFPWQSPPHSQHDRGQYCYWPDVRRRCGDLHLRSRRRPAHRCRAGRTGAGGWQPGFLVDARRTVPGRAGHHRHRRDHPAPARQARHRRRRPGARGSDRPAGTEHGWVIRRRTRPARRRPVVADAFRALQRRGGGSRLGFAPPIAASAVRHPAPSCRS